MGVNLQNFEIVKYKKDGSAVAYPKLYTDNNMSIKSTFKRVAAESKIKKDLASKEKPIISVPATDYLNKPIEVIAGIRIAGVFVSASIETIRLRVTDAIVYRGIARESIFSEDLGITRIKDEDENEDNASE